MFSSVHDYDSIHYIGRSGWETWGFAFADGMWEVNVYHWSDPGYIVSLQESGLGCLCCRHHGGPTFNFDILEDALLFAERERGIIIEKGGDESAFRERFV